MDKDRHTRCGRYTQGRCWYSISFGLLFPVVTLLFYLATLGVATLYLTFNLVYGVELVKKKRSEERAIREAEVLWCFLCVFFFGVPFVKPALVDEVGYTKMGRGGRTH